MSMTNCINCGSAKETTQSVCPFCGTSYFDLTDIDLCRTKPCVVRFKLDGHTFQMKMFVRHAEFTIEPQYMDIRSLDGTVPRYLNTHNNTTVNIEFINAD